MWDPSSCRAWDELGDPKGQQGPSTLPSSSEPPRAAQEAGKGRKRARMCWCGGTWCVAAQAGVKLPPKPQKRCTRLEAAGLSPAPLGARAPHQCFNAEAVLGAEINHTTVPTGPQEAHGTATAVNLGRAGTGAQSSSGEAHPLWGHGEGGNTLGGFVAVGRGNPCWGSAWSLL